MTDIQLQPISESMLAEHWFSLRLKTWRAVKKAVKATGMDQKRLAERIGMDPAQLSKVLTGNKSNVTLRTLHNIARAANHRLQISLVPLADLPKPNYSFEARKQDDRERAALFERTTVTDFDINDSWSPPKALETAGAGSWR